jgi:erythromycin esterase
VAGEDSTAQHTVRYWIAPRFAWGRRVRVTGWVRAQRLDGQARLVLEAWGAGVLASDTASLLGGGDGDEWQRLDLSVLVDSSAHSIVVSAGLLGTGSVWFDDLAVEAGGRTWDTVPAAAAPGDVTLDWLFERASSFSSIDTGELGLDEFADLAAFGRIVGEARVVALGESTHGTSEFFRVKHRLLAYLVEHAGFRVFAIEANQLAVEPINDYVRGGSGDPLNLMRAMFRVWNTEEMRDLINWMRAYNAEHPGRMVEFIGFDMQDPRHPIDSVSSFLRRIEPTLRPWADSLYAPYRDAWREANYPQGPTEVRQSWHANALEVYERVRGYRDRWLARAADRADSIAAEWVVQNANVARQAALSALTMDFATRDSAMAENIRWALERRPEGTRVVVWAHDGHISRAAHASANYWGGGSMGGELATLFGDEYRAFGLLTHAGSYSGAMGSDIIDTELFPAPAGSLEEALHQVGQRLGSSLLIADIRNAMYDPAGSWLLEPRLIRMIGYAAEDFAFASPISVGSQFDGVVFVDTTSPSRVFR